VAGETLIKKIADEPYNLIIEMTLNNYQWSNEKKGQPMRLGGKFELDALPLLIAKMDVIA